MKILIHKPRSEGSVLLISLLTCAIIGIALASYLTLTQTQNISVTRSQGWNTAIALTEAGVEEALSQLNRGAPYFDPKDSTNNLASNGWTINNGRYVAPRRYLGPNFYDVSIRLSGGSPVINSTGFVFMASSYSYAPQTFFAQIGGDGQGTPTAFKGRRVRVMTKIDPLFAVAMAALQKIDFSGRNVQTDSYDSGDPNYSDNGLYPFSNINKTKDNGDVVTDAGIINSLAVGNAKIKGQAKTGPNGSITLGPNGSVGDRAWVEGGNTGIQPSHSANDMNVSFPMPTLPNTVWLPAIQGNYTINGKTYDYAILTDGDYSIPGLTHNLYVGSNVTVKIQFTEDVNLTGNGDEIHIGAGSTVRIYMNADKFVVRGNGIVNENGNASSLFLYGLAANTTIEYGGNNSFTGAIYAPGADFSLGGGGNNTYDFIGASVSKTVKMNGHFNFHYDENLKRVNPSRGWIPSNWNERIASDEVAVGP